MSQRRGTPFWVLVTRPRPDSRELDRLEAEAAERRRQSGSVQKEVLVVLRGPERLVTKFESAAFSKELLASDEVTLLWCCLPPPWEFVTSPTVLRVLQAIGALAGEASWAELQQRVNVQARPLVRVLREMEAMDLLRITYSGRRVERVHCRWDEILYLDHDAKAQPIMAGRARAA